MCRFTVSARTYTPPALLLLLLQLVTCREPLATATPQFLQATGSTAMSPLVVELAAAYHETRPLVSLDVTGLGSQAGLEALRAGEADMALASWLPAELDTGWRATAIARDGIAVIVHPDNPVDGLGLLQVRDLFTGRVYEWHGIGGKSTQGPVQPVSRELGSGTRDAFEAMVMEGQRVTPQAIVASSSEAVVAYVAEHPQAIGYVSQGFLSPRVKALTVEGELPTARTAGQASYPLSRELWLITVDPPPAAAKDFIQFALGAAGQQIVDRRYGRIR